MATPILENEHYQLFMQGSVHKWTRTGTSDHYYDYEDHYHQWRGGGVVVDKKTGRSIQFNFSSPASRSGKPEPDIKTLVLRTNRRISEVFTYYNASAQELALPNQESNIINFVCKRLLDKIAGCADPIKAIVVDPMPVAELIKPGIVADDSGQIHFNLINGMR